VRLIAGIAWEIGLSREMGALVAGASLSTFPYNVDVIAKGLNIRDFFVTLFFVGLGLQIPMPTVSLLVYAGAASFFLIVTRFLSVFPVLYLYEKRSEDKPYPFHQSFADERVLPCHRSPWSRTQAHRRRGCRHSDFRLCRNVGAIDLPDPVQQRNSSPIRALPEASWLDGYQ